MHEKPAELALNLYSGKSRLVAGTSQGHKQFFLAVVELVCR